jgi:hypothetical protein
MILYKGTKVFLEQIPNDVTPYGGQWILFEPHPKGKKMFMNYYSKESALSAVEFYGLTLLSDENEV